MLEAVAAILLCSLLSQVNGLIKTDAKCLAGYEWMFSSIGQSPCDVAAELASVCVGGQFNLQPIGAGYIYAGPAKENANDCRCSSVYYSMLSACAYCQGRDYLQWSVYDINCTTVSVPVYNQPIPAGVKVPDYAYQNVSISNTFDVKLAQSMKGAESTRAPPSSTPVSKPIPTLSPTIVGSSGNTGTPNNTPAIIGGVVGGVIALGLIATLIIFLLLRSKQETKSLDDSSNFRLSNMASMSKMTSPTRSRPGSPGLVSNANGTYHSNDPTMIDPHRQHSPHSNQGALPNYTGHSAQNYMANQTHHDGRAHYTGMPEI